MDDLLAELDEASIRYVRATWCDLGNQVRAKAVHRGSLKSARDFVVMIPTGSQGMAATMDAVLPGSGLSPVGEMQLAPDWSTLCPLPFAPGHARVMSDMTVDGRPWEYCPRGFVRRMEARAGELGLTVTAGFENEFYLLREGLLTPADETSFASVDGMNQNRAVIDELTDMLLAQRMTVLMYHPESGPGQQEISIRHASPLTTADQQVALRETVHAVARRHGMRATFLPKPFLDRVGSGCHLHVGLEGRMSDPQGRWGLSEVARQFMAGVLEHLGALVAVTAP
ncbi:MAG: glutamine synthetase, partial [Candidatus Eremiobacterota bacterium]